MNEQTNAKPALDLPELRQFLPLVYVAWADGELHGDEIRQIRSHIESHPALGPQAAQRLESWLDPEAPPRPTDIYRLLRNIQTESDDLDGEARLGLADLGREISKNDDADCRAVRELEQVLGIETAALGRRILRRHRPRRQTEEPERADFDVDAMTAMLDGPRADLKREVRALLSEPEFAPVLELSREAHRAQVTEWLAILARRGYGGLAFPVSAGGSDDLAGFVAVFETLAHHDLSLLVKFGVQFGLFGGSIQNLGTDRHHALLKDVARFALPGCFAMTEVGHGSNVRDLETVARYDAAREEWVIHSPTETATKTWIGNAAKDGRLATVFAQLEVNEERYGVHAFLVPIRTDAGRPAPGVRIADNGPKMGLNGVDNGQLAFDHVRIPRENLLDRFGRVSAQGEYDSHILGESKRFFTMLGTLVGGRVSVAFAGLSASKNALAIAVRYAGARRQFGPPDQPEMKLLDYLTHQRRLLPRLAQTYALNFALQDLLTNFVEARRNTEAETQSLEGEAAALKAMATWHATDTIQECREACGGNGYAAENRFVHLKNDSDVFTTFEGDNTVLMQLLTRSLLSEYKRQFENFDFDLVMGLAGKWASRTVDRLKPIFSGTPSSEHLRDPRFLGEVLSTRKEDLLVSLAQRLNKRLKAGASPTDAFTAVQDHALSAAFAHVEYVVFQAFARGVERAEAGPERDRLERVLALFGLSKVQADKGWFLENGYFSSKTTRAVLEEINALCGQLRPDAVALVDAFGIPDEVLAAPIAVGKHAVPR